jgi:hypothetical protein
MRETGMVLAIDEGSAGLLPIRVLISWGRNELPPLAIGVAPSHRRLAGPSRSPQLRTGVELALQIVPGA